MVDIEILLYDGFDELDAVGPFEVFRNAAAAGCALDARLVTVEPTGTVVASHGLRVEPDGVLGDPDLLVVPGGGWSHPDRPGAGHEYERGVVPDRIASLHDDGVRVAAVCTGGMLVAGAGLLDGRPAVTHHSALDDLAASGADVRDARVVDDGDVLTAAGVTSGLDLALHVVESECGADVAEDVARQIEYERRFEVETSA